MLKELSEALIGLAVSVDRQRRFSGSIQMLTILTAVHVSILYFIFVPSS